MLTLPIKGCWFYMIVGGEKKEEYRADTPYYRTRFAKLFDLSPEALADPEKQRTAEIILKNGYGADVPAAKITCKLQYGTGRPEWGATEEPCFILRILAVGEA